MKLSRGSDPAPLLTGRGARGRGGEVGLLALLVLAPLLLAHGGEDHDHGERGAPTARDESTLRVSLETQFLLGVRTQLARPAVLAESVGVSGVVRARPEGEAQVAAPFPGRIEAPPGGFPRLGARVHRGDALAQVRQVLGAAEYATLAQARQGAALARSDAQQRRLAVEARLRLAQENAARAQTLRGVLSEREIAAAQTEVSVARAELAQAQRDLATPALGAPAPVTLRAPIDGTLVLVEGHVTEGTQVEPTTTLFRVADLSSVWVDTQVTEAQAVALNTADEAQVTSLADPSFRATARRVAVAAQVDPVTRTVQALFELPNPDARLRLGSSVDVAVRGPAGEAHLVLPRAAVLDREGASVVVVKSGPEEFSVRVVRLGARNAASIAVLSGLHEGERVVTSGADRVVLAAR